jgi:hypothetical protein
MNSLDDHALKAEIDEIAKRIDLIIKNVNQIQPESPETNHEHLEHLAEQALIDTERNHIQTY